MLAKRYLLHGEVEVESSALEPAQIRVYWRDLIRGLPGISGFVFR